MASKVFRKTDKGRAEIERRSGMVPGALRSVLVAINGRDDVDSLAISHDQSGVEERLAALLDLGLIEEVVQPGAAPQAEAPPPPPPLPPPPPSPPPLPASFVTRQQQVLACLAEHCGPSTTAVAKDMLAARDAHEFDRALKGIEAQLAVYMGRKQAVRLLAEFRMTSP
ncbi:MAG: hypothetical protein LBE62_12390 [Azonexus sp.]|nr:hypothetical protein [Azonexus sp.]